MTKNNHLASYSVILIKRTTTWLSFALTIPVYYAVNYFIINIPKWVGLFLPFFGLFLSAIKVGYEQYKLNQRPDISFQPADKNILMIVSNSDVHRGLQLCDAVVSNNNPEISLVISKGSLHLREENLTAPLAIWILRETGKSESNLILEPGESKKVSPMFSVNDDIYNKLRASSERLVNYELKLTAGNGKVVLINQQTTLIPK